MRLGFLRERLVDHIVAVLDSAAGSNERAAPMGHWRAVFEKVTAARGSCSPAVRLNPASSPRPKRMCLVPSMQQPCLPPQHHPWVRRRALSWAAVRLAQTGQSSSARCRSCTPTCSPRSTRRCACCCFMLPCRLHLVTKDIADRVLPRCTGARLLAPAGDGHQRAPAGAPAPPEPASGGPVTRHRGAHPWPPARSPDLHWRLILWLICFLYNLDCVTRNIQTPANRLLQCIPLSGMCLKMIHGLCTEQTVVEERLSVRLEPVDLRLKPPSAQEFHDSLQRLFSEGCSLLCWTPLCAPARMSDASRNWCMPGAHWHKRELKKCLGPVCRHHPPQCRQAAVS